MKAQKPIDTRREEPASERPTAKATDPRVPSKTNPRLTQQNRKILGKHYANRFGKR